MSLFFKRLKGGLTWLKKPQDSKASSQQAVLYQDLSLPLNIFIKCLVHQDLSGLVLKGTPKPEEVAIAWAHIYNQYIDLNSENEQSYILQLQVDITLLKSHISEVETALYFLKDVYHEGLVKILEDNDYDPPTKDEFENKAVYFHRLSIVQNQLAIKHLQLSTKQKEYEDYIANKANDDVTEKYFTTTLLRLAKYQGVAIIKSSAISVEEFVLLLNDYLASLKTEEEPKDIDGNER